MDLRNENMRARIRAEPEVDIDTPDWGKGQWCACGLPHETGGPCWECRRDEPNTLRQT